MKRPGFRKKITPRITTVEILFFRENVDKLDNLSPSNKFLRLMAGADREVRQMFQGLLEGRS